MGFISTYNRDCGTAVGRYPKSPCLTCGEKAGRQFGAVFVKHLEPANCVRAPSAATYDGAADPGCGRASRADSPVLFLTPFISVGHGPVTLPGEMGAGDKPGFGCRRSKTLQRKWKVLVTVAVLLLWPKRAGAGTGRQPNPSSVVI